MRSITMKQAHILHVCTCIGLPSGRHARSLTTWMLSVERKLQHSSPSSSWGCLVCVVHVSVRASAIGCRPLLLPQSCACFASWAPVLAQNQELWQPADARRPGGRRRHHHHHHHLDRAPHDGRRAGPGHHPHQHDGRPGAPACYLRVESAAAVGSHQKGAQCVTYAPVLLHC